MSVAISPSARLAAYSVAGILTLLLSGHFAASLPDAIERGREGLRRNREAPCQVLRPASLNPVLGRLPKPAPDFSLQNHAGQSISLSSLRGRVVLVNFWATWCDTCLIEMPSLERLATRLQGKPFSLLGISVDENWDAVRSFFPRGSTMSILLDKDRTVPRSYGTEKFPESFLIDAQGNVRYYVISERQNWHSDEVQKCIEALLE